MIFRTRKKYGEVPESAMVITDKQGDIVAIAGGRGQKSASSRVLAYASDARRQPGSSIKPLASYGPGDGCGHHRSEHDDLRPRLLRGEDGIRGR